MEFTTGRDAFFGGLNDLVKHLIIDHWILFIDHWILFIDYWIFIIDCWIL